MSSDLHVAKPVPGIQLKLDIYFGKVSAERRGKMENKREGVKKDWETSHFPTGTVVST